MTDQATQDAPTLPDHRTAVTGQVERSVRPHVVPITLKQAREFVAAHHRHNKPPVGWKFGVGLYDPDKLHTLPSGLIVVGKLVGVATAGRPVARHYDDGTTLEVNRTCTDGTPNANSMLYGAVWRAAKAMGYKRCITYTQADETGASLRAAGWVKVKTLEARKSWAESSVALKDKRDRAHPRTTGATKMSREVRRVPADWQHPKHWTGGMRGPEERYKPLSPGERYQPAVDEWDAGLAAWKRGEYPEYADPTECQATTYEQYSGQRPHRDDYMPNWPAEQRTHLMMYEDTSEGTPISPAFATPEELARWLVDNKASAFGSDTGSYEGWLRVARGGWAPSMVASAARVVSGVDAL